jgi:hypothetical protein
MNYPDDNDVKKLMLAIFHRKGRRSGDVVTADDDFPLLSAQQAALALAKGELPVIFVSRGGPPESVITTQRIIWCDTGKSILLSDIVQISPNGPMTLMSKVSALRLEVSGGHKILNIGAGPPLIGVWSVLLNRVRAERRRRRAH